VRLVIQRVSEASVSIDKNRIASIANGLLVLVGIEHEDNQEDIDWLVKKTCGMRIFNDDEGKMNRSVVDVAGELLIVSQFTLHASTKKGSRPSFIAAAKPDVAIPFYDEFIRKCRELVSVQTGKFGADMKISLTNDGPVTIFLDSKQKA